MVSSQWSGQGNGQTKDGQESDSEEEEEEEEDGRPDPRSRALAALAAGAQLKAVRPESPAKPAVSVVKLVTASYGNYGNQSITSAASYGSRAHTIAPGTKPLTKKQQTFTKDFVSKSALAKMGECDGSPSGKHGLSSNPVARITSGLLLVTSGCPKALAEHLPPDPRHTGKAVR